MSTAHEHVMEPTAAQLAALSGSEDAGPVVMLNLVRFNDASTDGDGRGSDAYLRYSRGFMPLLKRAGGTILWAGNVTGVAIGSDTDDAWDYAVLVQYPNRRAFVDTLTSPEYAAINDTRLAGLAKHLILPVTPTYSKSAADRR
jgi:uncharacterized protein (DUF1330 family)